MLFGQSSAHIDYETIEEAFDKLAKWGMNHFELFGHDANRREFGLADFEKISKLADAGALTVAFHPLYRDEFDLGLVAPSVGVRVYSRVLDQVHAMGATYVVMHLGSSEERGGGLENAVGIIERVLPKAQSLGAKLCIEDFTCCHWPNALGDCPGDFDFLFREIDSEWLGLAIDYGHAHITGYLDEYLERFGHKLFYTHIADNDGADDQHIGAGLGTIDWPRAFADTLATGFRGPFTIEYPERFADECHDDVRRWLGLCDG